MRGVNRATILGTLGKDPELRYSASGTAVANFSVATNEEWKDKSTGEKQERTEWHNIVIWGKLGEIAGKYLHKGAQVYLEGRIQTRKWQDREGTDRYSTEINVSEMQMLGKKGDNQSSGSRAPDNRQRPAEGPAQDDAFDDIPF